MLSAVLVYKTGTKVQVTPRTTTITITILCVHTNTQYRCLLQARTAFELFAALNAQAL